MVVAVLMFLVGRVVALVDERDAQQEQGENESMQVGVVWGWCVGWCGGGVLGCVGGGIMVHTQVMHATTMNATIMQLQLMDAPSVAHTHTPQPPHTLHTGCADSAD